MEPHAEHRGGWPQHRAAFWTIFGIGLAVGVVSAWQSVTMHVDESLRRGRGTTGSLGAFGRGLLIAQVALSMTLAAVGSGSSLENLDAFRAQCRANAEQLETIGSIEVAKVTREAPSRIPFLLQDPRGHADFYAALSRHDAKGSANTMRGFQGGRPSIYNLTDAIRKASTPVLIICGDEDDPCVGASLFLKKHLPAAGLAMFPKSGHVLNLEEPALFNETVERFVTLVEAGRWPVRDPRSTAAH